MFSQSFQVGDKVNITGDGPNLSLEESHAIIQAGRKDWIVIAHTSDGLGLYLHKKSEWGKRGKNYRRIFKFNNVQKAT